MIGLALLGLLACQPAPPTSDAVLYTEVIGDPGGDPELSFAACDAIRNASARGDCQLGIARATAQVLYYDPETYCDRVDEGTWRYECYFQAAETWRRAGDEARAVRICRRAGPFEPDCLQHLWRTSLHVLLEDRGSAAFAHGLAEAEALRAEWATQAPDPTAFERRFWWEYYRDGFEQDSGAGAPLRLSACDPLPDVHRRRCRRIASRVYWTRLIVIAPSLPEFCEGAAQASLVQVPGLEAELDPMLDEAIARARGELCD